MDTPLALQGDLPGGGVRQAESETDADAWPRARRRTLAHGQRVSTATRAPSAAVDRASRGPSKTAQVETSRMRACTRVSATRLVPLATSAASTE